MKACLSSVLKQLYDKRRKIMRKDGVTQMVKQSIGGNSKRQIHTENATPKKLKRKEWRPSVGQMMNTLQCGI